MKRRACLFLLIATLGCQSEDPAVTEAAEPEPHPETFTNWTLKTELFVEYPPLVTGQTSRFAIHLTRLDNFKPVTQGRAEVRLASATGTPEVFAADSPSRPGIFGVDVEPSRGGEYRLSIHYEGEGINDVHDLGDVASSATTAEAFHEHGEETVETISFLKEQQWTLDFATAIVEDRQMKSSLRVPAEVTARSGGEAEVSVPFDGRLVFDNPVVLGSQVKRGQVLANVLPPTSSPSDLASLELARDEASLEIQLARKDRDRAERLVAAGAAPAKRLDEARTVELTAEARLKTAETRIAQYEESSVADGHSGGAKLFALRAPISGLIVLADAAPGTNVKAGQVLFRIVDLDTVYVSAIVPEAELPMISRLSGAEMEVPGSEQRGRLQRLVSVGRVVDPASRTFPVIYEVDNRERRIAINQAVHVRLLTETTAAAPVVAESAIVDDGGRPIIFIQAEGEAFLRRPVSLGAREGGYVQVLEGAWPGERVVTKGAHLIRLAAMSSQVPAHGHVH